jgi:hypothetical protein
MAKPPKTPRPQKPPVLPALSDQFVDPTISMLTERLIGRAIVSWSKLENCMDDFIWALLAVPIARGRIITVRMDAVRKIQTLRLLGELVLSEEKFHALSPILDQIDILREDRNLIGHGSWGRTGVDRINVVVSLKPDAPEPDQVVSETFPDSRLRAVIDGIERAKWQIIPLMEEHYASLDKSLRQHHEAP